MGTQIIHHTCSTQTCYESLQHALSAFLLRHSLNLKQIKRKQTHYFAPLETSPAAEKSSLSRKNGTTSASLIASIGGRISRTSSRRPKFLKRRWKGFVGNAYEEKREDQEEENAPFGPACKHCFDKMPKSAGFWKFSPNCKNRESIFVKNDG